MSEQGKHVFATESNMNALQIKQELDKYSEEQLAKMTLLCLGRPVNFVVCDPRLDYCEITYTDELKV